MKKGLFKVAEIRLSYRNKQAPEDQPKISSSKDAYEMFLNNWEDGMLDCQEHFKVAVLNNANRCIGILTASKGGITGTVVDLRLIFAAAIKACATGIILAHNHPSGKLQASFEDEKITAKCKQVGTFHDIKVLDHIIVTRNGYLSFADDGKL